jgi:hypothetical protein
MDNLYFISFGAHKGSPTDAGLQSHESIVGTILWQKWIHKIREWEACAVRELGNGSPRVSMSRPGRAYW